MVARRLTEAYEDAPREPRDELREALEAIEAAFWEFPSTDRQRLNKCRKIAREAIARIAHPEQETE